MPASCPAPIALKARAVVTLVGASPARGTGLFKPVRIIDNGVAVVANGIIQSVGHHAPPDCRVCDLGDVALLPAAVNCHTHLQLSCLAGQTALGAGFTTWLKSLVPLVLKLLKNGFRNNERTALASACAFLAESGCAGVGDVGGSLPGALAACNDACLKHGLHAVHFCEHFGFAENNGIWPDRCRAELKAFPLLLPHSAPAGHALYSTSPATLQKAHAFCAATSRPFSFHLAESAEETDLLATGSGPLHDYYQNMVLPPDWQPPRLSPLHYAAKLGILSRSTLAVHGVWLEKEEIDILRDSGATLCLCPRSNQAIGAGSAPIRLFMQKGLRLCLGTDGLTSAPDLDVRREAFFLHTAHDIPWQALWRLAITNGASALGLPLPIIAKNRPARFSIWPLP